MSPITDKSLYPVVRRINDILHVAPDTYQLDRAYGGVRLERITEAGGAIDVLESGYVSKRELYNLMHAFIRGINAAREIADIKEISNVHLGMVQALRACIDADGISDRRAASALARTALEKAGAA